MQDSTKKQLQRATLDWLGASADRSQGTLARLTGVNPAYISRIANGTWDDKLPGIAQWNKLGSFFQVSHHIDSINYLNIVSACATAQEEGGRVAIDGYTGAGKTYALRRYQKANANVYLIQANPSMTRRAFVWEIARQVGIDKLSSSLYALLQDVITRLENKAVPALLIFDEIEYLPESAYHIIKTLMDNLEGRVGFVVSGIFRESLEKSANRGKPGFPQMLRRVGHSWLEMQRIDKKDVRSLCEQNGIMDASVVGWLMANARDYDALATYVKDLVKVSEKNTKPINIQLCETLFMR